MCGAKTFRYGAVKLSYVPADRTYSLPYPLGDDPKLPFPGAAQHVPVVQPEAESGGGEAGGRPVRPGLPPHQPGVHGLRLHQPAHATPCK